MNSNVNLIIFFILFLFIIFICFFIYKGTIIYDLITSSKYNYIYEKIDKDAISLLEKDNQIYTFAVNKNYMYKAKANLNSNSLFNELHITQNRDMPILNLDKDFSKLVTLLKNKKNFSFHML